MIASTVFFLIIGQAGSVGQIGGGVVLVPTAYSTLVNCETAGDLAIAHNNGLSYLSYACVPAERNVDGNFVGEVK